MNKKSLALSKDIKVTKEAAMREREKFPTKNVDAHKKRLIRVLKYGRKQKHGNPYYVEIVSTKRKIPVANKKEGNSLREYIWEYVIKFGEEHPYRRGRALEHEEQWYFEQSICHEINNFVLEIKNGRQLIGKTRNTLGPTTIKNIFDAFTGINRLLTQVFPKTTLKAFFNPIRINENLDRLLEVDRSKKHHSIRAALSHIHVFDGWITEKAKRKIAEKFGSNSEREEFHLNLLANSPLIATSTYSELRKIKKNLDSLKEKRPVPEFDCPKEFIEKLENGLSKLTTVSQLTTAFSIILNTVFCFRQNEFCALKFSDLTETKEGGIKVKDFLRSVSHCKQQGNKIVHTNKTNIPLTRYLDPYYIKYINYLKHPLFSRHKTNYIREITLRSYPNGRKEFIIKGKSGKRFSRRVPNEYSFLQCLEEFGFELLTKEFFPSKLKREFLMENSQRFKRPFYNTRSFQRMHERVLSILKIKYKSPHRRFRADPVTSKLKRSGLGLENFQSIKNVMGWKSDAMVHNYINEIKRTNQEETSLIGSPKSGSKNKSKISLGDLSNEDREELLRQAFDLIEGKTLA